MNWLVLASSVMLGCGPSIVLEGEDSGGGSSSGPVLDGPSTDHSHDTTTSTHDVTSDVTSSGGIDPDTSGTESSGDSGGPELPPLPRLCSGDLLMGDVLDPNEVYIAGTLSEGACYLDALAHWTTPNDAVAGFDCYFDERRAVIRPSDGRLLYTNTFEGLLREFHCDTCPIVSGDPYPNDPLSNDFVLPTPACAPGTATVPFLVSPAGDYLYRCPAPGWYDASGALVYQNPADELLHLGYDGLALTQQHVLDLATGTNTPTAGLPAGDPYVIRADPEDGFFVVMLPQQPELWHVSATGDAVSMGLYSAIPPGYSGGTLAALDGCGALLEIGRGLEVFEDIILRREVGGETWVVYSESFDPLVKLHISDLVTGP